MRDMWSLPSSATAPFRSPVGRSCVRLLLAWLSAAKAAFLFRFFR